MEGLGYWGTIVYRWAELQVFVAASWEGLGRRWPRWRCSCRRPKGTRALVSTVLYPHPGRKYLRLCGIGWPGVVDTIIQCVMSACSCRRPWALLGSVLMVG